MPAEPHGDLYPGCSPRLWWACSEPERPPDPFVLWDYDCSACRVKARVVVAAGGPGTAVLGRHFNLE